MSLLNHGLNGSATVLGRGLARRKLTFDEKARLAADCVAGLRRFVPSIEHASQNFGIPRHVVSRHVRLRTGAASAGPTSPTSPTSTTTNYGPSSRSLMSSTTTYSGGLSVATTPSTATLKRSSWQPIFWSAFATGNRRAKMNSDVQQTLKLVEAACNALEALLGDWVAMAAADDEAPAEVVACARTTTRSPHGTS
jgi:hypothetical protein